MSEPGPGSSLVLVSFAVEGRRLALPLAAVERVLPMAAAEPLPGAPAIALGAINLHGSVVPVLDLRSRLGLPARAPAPEDRLVVARSRGRRVALAVDEALGLAEVDGSELAAPAAVLPGLGLLAGVAALPDGLLVVHDLDAFLSLDEERQLDRALSEARA